MIFFFAISEQAEIISTILCSNFRYLFEREAPHRKRRCLINSLWTIAGVMDEKGLWKSLCLTALNDSYTFNYQLIEMELRTFLKWLKVINVTGKSMNKMEDEEEEVKKKIFRVKVKSEKKKNSSLFNELMIIRSEFWLCPVHESQFLTTRSISSRVIVGTFAVCSDFTFIYLGSFLGNSRGNDMMRVLIRIFRVMLVD